MQPTGDKIARAVPAVLERVLPGPIFPADSSGRLELARWMADSENPLTSRVAVNRIWTWHFGTGIVDTPSNFGVIGSKPAHPELLDYLARRFADGGWSMKAMHRLVMASATYRQSSATHTALPEHDPDNHLLTRFPRRRVEAEIIRDAVLATSGDLDRSVGGTLLGIGDHDYVTNDQSGNGAKYDSNRRSIYLPVIRNAMFGLFTAFDYPDASTPIDCRPHTVVAPQALFFMNAPFVETAAMKIAGADVVNGQQGAAFAQALVNTLAQMGFDFVVWDLGQSFHHPLHLTPLLTSDLNLIVVTPDKSTLVEMELALPDLKKDVEISSERFRLVINRWSDAMGISPREIVQRLGMPEFARIPYGANQCVDLALQHSKPLVLDTPNDVSNAIIGLVKGLYRPIELVWQAKGGDSKKKGWFRKK